MYSKFLLGHDTYIHAIFILSLNYIHPTHIALFVAKGLTALQIILIAISQ